MTAPTPARTTYMHADRISFRGLLVSEWTKLSSLPSIVISLVGIIVIGVGASLFLAAMLESSGVPSVVLIPMTISDSLTGLTTVSAIVAGVIGVLAIGSEYTSGTIRVTFAAVPKRGRVLAAKAVTVFAATTIASLVAAFGSWAIAYPFYARFGLQAPLDAPGVLPALIGAGCYLGICALVGLGIGAIVRSTTAGAIIFIAITFITPVITGSLLPYSTVTQTVRALILSRAGDAMASAVVGGSFINIDAGQVSHLAGWLIALAWTLIALVSAWLVMRRRDA